MGDLSKQVEDPTQSPELVAMKRKIQGMQVAYVILFICSLALIVYSYQARTSSSTHYLWALALGSSVVVRLIRQSMVNKYNQILTGGRPAPLT
jgi:hypothetical protein